MHGKFDDLGRFSDPSVLILTSLSGGPKILPDNSSRDTAFTWPVTASGSLTGGTAAAQDTWDGQPAPAPDGRTIIDGSAFGRTTVGLWMLPATAGQP